MTLAGGDTVATFARETYGRDVQRVGKLQCWDAVLDCLQMAGGITKGQRVDLARTPWIEDFSRVIPPHATLVRNAEEMRRVPAGAFIGFIEVLPPNAYYRALGQSLGERGLKHAMLSLGDGWAAGIKNACVGLSEGDGTWECLDVADLLNWLPGHQFNSFNAVPRAMAQPSPSGARAAGYRPMRIRYRTLGSLRETPSVLAHPERFERSAPLVMKSGLSQETVTGATICSSGPIGDGVVIAATREVGGESRTFVWMVRSPGRELTAAAFNQSQVRAELVQFLAGAQARWAYYYGEGGSQALVDAVHASWFHRQVVVPYSASPLHELGGTRVWVDGRGEPQNLPELTAIP